jgi:hypothetical protein
MVPVPVVGPLAFAGFGVAEGAGPGQDEHLVGVVEGVLGEGSVGGGGNGGVGDVNGGGGEGYQWD